MFKGSLIHSDYKDLLNKENIYNRKFKEEQIQPSSMDLTLSEECYEIKASILASESNVRNVLKRVIIKKIDLKKGYIFKKNKIYLVKINEKLNLPKNIFGKCNPKSSTGRLDIFCRTILDYSDEYEKIPLNYRGEIFLEVTSRSFDIKFQRGNSLNQMRLVFLNHQYVTDKKLEKYHNQKAIIYDNKSQKIKANILNGLKISVDLANDGRVKCFIAKKNAPVLDFNKINCHEIKKFWNFKYAKNKELLIEPGNFYILKSKEKVLIPSNMAGEMIPYDTGIGDFRVHYAGFFDPGFGNSKGSYAVLEVKTNEVPFILQDNQNIAKIKYERLNKKSKMLYGAGIKSNYQNQELKLSKHFLNNKNK